MSDLLIRGVSFLVRTSLPVLGMTQRPPVNRAYYAARMLPEIILLDSEAVLQRTMS